MTAARLDSSWRIVNFFGCSLFTIYYLRFLPARRIVASAPATAITATSAAAVAAATITTTSAAAAAAVATIFTRSGFVDGQVATIHVGTIKLFDCFLAFFLR